MDQQKQALVDKLKGANNILVTVSANPSIDQLAAAIGLTLFLNKLKKHATAVFSGEVPSTLEFLKPEDTLEKTTDSLRDFIISLDKSKADKLRYKVEENVVKIFITPYRTSLSQDDLEFGQGDFNVDVVIALGVHEQQDLDQAIISHGRILHDATVMSVNVRSGPELGSVNWTVPDASSLSELGVELADGLSKDLMDGQIATAFLTGIVAETERFSNEKTSPETMRLSAELLTAGANQQLVSTELQKDEEPPAPEAGRPANDNQPKPPKPDNGTLEIAHSAQDSPQDEPTDTSSQEAKEASDSQTSQEIHDVKRDTFDSAPPADAQPTPQSELPPQHYISEPPVLGGQLTANSEDEGDGESVASLPAEDHDGIPLLSRDHPATANPAAQPVTTIKPTNPAAPTAEVAANEEQPQQPVWQPEPMVTATQSDEPPMDLPTPEISPSETASADSGFQPLATEPEQAVQSATDLAPTMPAPPAASDVIQPTPAAPNNDQIKIDAEGNIDGPAPSTVVTPISAEPLKESPSTLAELEKAVDSPHVSDELATAPAESGASTASDIDAALKAVQDVYNSTPVNPEALPAKQDVGAAGYLKIQDLPDVSDPVPVPDMPGSPQMVTFVPLTPDTSNAPPMVAEPTPGHTPADTPLTMPLPPTMPLPSAPASDQPAPPPVPPPLPPSMMMPGQ